jgi:hypothetical protein
LDPKEYEKHLELEAGLYKSGFYRPDLTEKSLAALAIMGRSASITDICNNLEIDHN